LHAEIIAAKHIFQYPAGLPQQDAESQDTMIRVGFGVKVPKTLIVFAYADFDFLLHYAITIYQHYRRMDGQTDAMLVALARHVYHVVLIKRS